MRVLALNCGSSSVKFLVAEVPASSGAATRLARGALERIGAEAVLSTEVDGRTEQRPVGSASNHAAAVARVCEWTRSSGFAVEAAGHRVVHGGARFTSPTVIDVAVIEEIEALEDLAPLHNAPSVAGIRAARTLLGARMPMVAVFDTAFHATLPDSAVWYAIPLKLARKHGVRRYGFHGTSYRYVLDRYASLTQTPPEQATLVAFHLGNGSSAAAIRDGRSVDTSMGFTPLEGLVMGTRSGDVDPSIVPFLARKEGVTAEAIERMLNEESGLLGLSGTSRDMRDLLARSATDARARLAVDVFCHRARKYLGAYLAVLGGADAVVFTGGIGEHSPHVRARICERMEFLGIRLDPALNERCVDGRDEVKISAEDSRVGLFVIPTDEEILIARDTADCLRRATGGSHA